MRPRTLLALTLALATGGCNLVFGLDPARLDPDAVIEPALDARLPLDADPGCAGLPDEDSDGIRDDCDLCPQLAAATIDSDTDGIGDACDPHVGVPDRLRAFFGFGDVDPPPQLDYFVGGGGIATWRTTGGALHLVDVGAGVDALAAYPVNQADVTVDTTFEVLAPVEPAQVIGLYASIVGGAADPARPDGIALVMGTPQAMTVARFLVVIDVGTITQRAVALPDPMFEPGARIRMVLTCQESPVPACIGQATQLAGAGSFTVDTIAMSPPATVLDGPVGLRVFGTSAAFEYLAVYSTP